ncbi:Sugar kinase of the NBD/HSP70 family, may contain an N-terminal HTH domain [Asanoa hainanensis]|uniref:Sugar kinase of the NBD/HSP70 family, may contain an N-terminal HTH domain n=1 Tax=Asanoa hainanensis TaxID=560556 RepID=A0A239GK45_9ACTN|nr:ROK family transcriptional regulator [Asanoa hainanensis]SNS69539.1 Sugar kinase of the NBD/HSP70 family, may contain an N-terminal HTH domain [Asanoa hainanensis]
MLHEAALAPAATAVFTAVLTEGPLSRVALARRLDLSSAAVTKGARPLIELGYLEELAATERTGPGAGRPASPLAVRADREFFVGVKITGDELIGVVCDLRAEIRASAHRPLPTPDVDQVLASLASLVDELLDGDFRARTRRLGLAVSGDVDYSTGLVRYSPFLGWRDVPLRSRAEQVIGLTVTVENDVKALTTAEHWFGEGVGAESFALVTVGAGIGCGLVVGGRLVSGSHGVAGEIGHIAVDANGPDCHCGGRGCVEALAGASAIVRQARAVAGRPELTLPDAVALARAGDAAVGAVFDRAGDAIGAGIAAVANLVGPARIVVSGEGLSAYDLFEPRIRESFQRQAFGAAADCPLSIRPLPFEQWARGAATVSIKALVAS